MLTLFNRIFYATLFLTIYHRFPKLDIKYIGGVTKGIKSVDYTLEYAPFVVYSAICTFYQYNYVYNLRSIRFCTKENVFIKSVIRDF